LACSHRYVPSQLVNKISRGGESSKQLGGILIAFVVIKYD
jgi:hypothetical protein